MSSRVNFESVHGNKLAKSFAVHARTLSLSFPLLYSQSMFEATGQALTLVVDHIIVHADRIFPFRKQDGANKESNRKN